MALVAGLLVTTGGAYAQPRNQGTGSLAGSLVGFVSDQNGVPRMGAAVLLFNGYDQLVSRVLTNEKGAFGFDDLSPGLYSLRVVLSSFVPAMRNRIEIQPGMRSFLSINLNSVLSSVELIYSAPGRTPLMSDDWKWVLKSAMSTRPVLRIRPQADQTKQDTHSERAAIFSNTRGMVKLSSGEEGLLSAAGAQADLGTAFALATSLFGGNELQFSGNVGYSSHAGIPTAGFRTSYSHEDPWGSRPEVNLTMRQIFLPARIGAASLTGGESPVLRTMSVSTLDRRRIGDSTLLEYGGSMESVVFLDRLNYFSPYGRLTQEFGRLGALQFAYSSGMPPAELLTSSQAPELDLQQDLTVVSLFPRLSLVNGDPRVQRMRNFELAWRKDVAGRTISIGAYRENVTNAAMMMAAPGGFYSQGDLLPDIGSNQSVFNLGRFDRLGYMASITQRIGEDDSLSLAYGSGGVLTPTVSSLATSDPQELRDAMHAAHRKWFAVRFTGLVPVSGTRFSTSYKVTDYSAVSPAHLYLTQNFQPDHGLNISIRQPLPSFGVWAGRLEASAELRNLLAQGYVPVSTPDGRVLYLVQNPRAVRGGLSFIF